jgi:hypothetical protein
VPLDAYFLLENYKKHTKYIKLNVTSNHFPHINIQELKIIGPLKRKVAAFACPNIKTMKPFLNYPALEITFFMRLALGTGYK